MYLYRNLSCTKRDLQKRPTKETYKRDLQKRPTKETYKRDLQKSCRFSHFQPPHPIYMCVKRSRRDVCEMHLYRNLSCTKRNLQKKPTKETYKDSNVREAHAPQRVRNVSLKKSVVYEKGQETVTRDLQNGPAKETYNRDPQNSTAKETDKRDLQRRPTRDLQKRPTKETLKSVLCAAYLWPAKHPTVNTDLFV